MKSEFKLKYKLLEKNSIDEIYELYDSKKIELPIYQRGLSWKPSQKHKLIESIQSGKPIGGFLFAKTESEETYKIIDGLQRFSTIIDFKEKPAKYISKSESLLSDDLIKDFIIFFSDSNGETREYESITNNEVNSIKMQILEKFSQLYEMHVKNPNKIYPELIKFYAPKSTTANFIDCLTEINEVILSKMKMKDACIPITVYTGDNQDELADIFVLLNNEGTALSKYEILAARWNSKTLKFTEEFSTLILEFITQKYDSISTQEDNETTLKYDNNNSSINLYEYFLALSIELSNTSLFYDDTSKFSKLEAGFILFSILLTGFPDKIDIMGDIVTDSEETNQKFVKGLENVYTTIISTVKELDEIISPFLLNGDKEKKIKFLSDYAKYNLFISYFLNKYTMKFYTFNDKEMSVDVLNKTIVNESKIYFDIEERNKDSIKNISGFKDNFLLHLIIDEMKNHWTIHRQTTDLRNEVSDIRKREKFWVVVTKHEFKKYLNTWINQQIDDDKEKYDTSLFRDEVKFITLVTHNFNRLQSREYASLYKKGINNIKIEFDHIVPKSIIDDKTPNRIYPKSSVLNILPLTKKANGIKSNNKINESKSGMNCNIDNKITSTYKVDLEKACISPEINDEEFNRKLNDFMKNRINDYVNSLLEIYSSLLD